MEKTILAQFDYNGKTYVYYVLSNQSQNLLYGYIDNGEIKPVVDSNDVFFMQEAYKKIFISTNPANHVKLSTTRYSGKLFQIMYDKISGLKFFYEIKDNKYYWPSSDEIKELFPMFNKFELYMAGGFIGKVKELPEAIGKSRIAISVGFGILSVLVLLDVYLVYTRLIAPSVPYSQTVQYIEKLESSADEPFSEEKLIEAINSNPYLTDDEKQYYFDELPYLIKYQKYVNFSDLVRKAKTVKIEYIEGPNEEEPWVTGKYLFDINTIRIYNCNSFKNASKSTLRHEVRHCVSGAHDSFGTGIIEATTEAVSFEYEDEDEYYGYSYHENVYYQKILYEIIGTEPFAAYEESGDISYITKALTKIIPDETEAIRLISYLGDLISYNIEISNCTIFDADGQKTVERKKEAEGNLKTTHAQILSSLEAYFKAAKGYSIYEDTMAMLCLKKLGLISSEIYLSFKEGDYNVYPISNFDLIGGYFIDKYIGNKPEGTIICRDYGGLEFTIASDQKLKPFGDNYILNAWHSVNINTDNIVFGEGLLSGLKEVVFEEANYNNLSEFNHYKEQSTYVKILCEIIGPEPFEKYLETGDISVIITALCNVDADKKIAQRLIDNIDLTNAYYEQLIDLSKPADSADDEAVGDTSDGLRKARGEIYSDLCHYFSQVNDYSLQDNVIMNTYYRELTSVFSFDCSGYIWPTTFVTDSGAEIPFDRYKSASVVKAYFDQDFKEAVPQPFIKIKMNDTVPENVEQADISLYGIITVDAHNGEMTAVFGEGIAVAHCLYNEKANANKK